LPKPLWHNNQLAITLGLHGGVQHHSVKARQPCSAAAIACFTTFFWTIAM
jgi:hypothetical protein